MHLFDADERYENIHKHTHKSNIMTMDSLITAEDIAKRAVELGHKTLSTVEHGYAGDVFEYYDVAEKYNLKMVFGVEYYYVNDRFAKDRTNAHLLILAKNNKGKRQLTKLISEAALTGFYFKPRIDKALLFSLNPEDVVVTSTCIASPYNAYKDECFITNCYDYFGENFYLEIHDNVHPAQIEYNKKLLKLHEQYNIPLIHATDTHYIHPEDAKDRDDLVKGKGIFYPEEDGFIMDYPDTKTIFERYSEQGVFTPDHVKRALVNTRIVDDFEDIEMNKDIKMPSIYPDLTHEQKMNKLKKIITKEWREDKKELSSDQIKGHLEAIRYETNIIEETAMEDYFLLNYEVIKKAKSYGGVLTRTGRGSAPSFYVNKLLGFTEIDRIEAPITLYPTRFMSKSRILETKSLPDIDFNTANPDPFIKATKEILGEDNCYYMLAYGTMQEAGAFKHLARARNVDKTIANVVSQDLDHYRTDPEWKDMIQESKKFIGVIDSVSPSPCAHLIMNKPISEEVGLIRTGDGKKKPFIYCSVIDSNTSDTWKYLKNDYLTVTVWRIISEVYKEIGVPIDNIRELIEKTKNDSNVWKLYEEGLTASLNQAGTDSGKPQVMKYKPKSIRELSGWVSAIRPAFSSMKHYFLNREPFTYNIPEFDRILRESDNFILFQENIMATLVYAGFDEDETYGLLKAISKKKEGIIEPIHDKFIKGFVEKTGNEEQALEVWKILEDAVGYGFNSSHAYAVALDSLYGAYLKANYPLEYFSVVLNVYEGSTAMTAKLKAEMDEFKIAVGDIEFGKSRAKYSPNKEENTIYKGIQSIKELNGQCAEELFELSQQKDYKKDDFVQLLLDIANTTLTKTHMETLIKLDFFRRFGEKEVLLEIYRCMFGHKKANGELYPNFADKEHVDNKGKVKVRKVHIKYDKSLKENTRIKRLELIKAYEKEVRANPPEKISIQDQVVFERDYLGYVSSKFNSPNSHCVVVELDAKYTPRLTLYQINKGKEIVVKIKKNTFFTDRGELCRVGDLIKVKSTFKDGKWVKKSNPKKGEFPMEQDNSIQELFISDLEVLN
ncbi:PHP domain-containing protein [Oceanobacillus kimchii]|uniref:DNA-directed DNA polymerase n=1 Tax=Oceanobacillus kimchii TaxID=746691 RepID=A0ABQ5TNY3_9BACI|nr:PHP domain-containing protein [Oceanobacillus kimchii]GLO66282.1 DNA-directed DNA polymerase [Oceanobacillus kimchii]